MIKNLLLGCPSWGNKDWIGSVFKKGLPQSQMLSQYSKVFNSVEGNTTFYATPNKDTVQRWQQEADDRFQFTFKFPKSISHEAQLSHCDREVNQFLTALEPIHENIGQLWLQLPPNFTPTSAEKIFAFANTLPKEFTLCVEVRHQDFYDEGDNENTWVSRLAEHQINWVHFDTKALFELEEFKEGEIPEVLTPSIKDALRKKPNMPPRFTATGEHPFLRFIAHDDPHKCEARLKLVAGEVGKWIEQGRKPYVMIHTPDCVKAPETARLFHELLSAQVDVGELDDWTEQHKPDQEQLSLF